MLSGRKTRIRPLELEDLDSLYLWYSDPEFTYWLSGNWPEKSLLRRDEIERRFFDEDPFRYALLDEAGALIGVIGFDELNIPARSVRLFLGIGEKAYWGKGYGTDALRCFTDHLFGHWNFHRLSLETWDGNKRALACYAKAGFQQEGVLKDAYYIDGRYRDGILLALVRS